MQQEYFPKNSEVLCVIGAGATAALGMPSTGAQTKILRELSESTDEQHTEKILRDYFSNGDLEKMLAFFVLLYGDDEKGIFHILELDLENAKILYGNYDKNSLEKRIHELREQFDWNAAKKVLKICPNPKDKNDDNLILDAYSIIDKKLISGQSLKVQNDESLSTSRLQGARNFLVLFVNMLFASRWNEITNGEKSEEFEKYKKFIGEFDKLMQKEGQKFYQKYDLSDREFYLFTTSFVSFNFEMIFPWLFMNSHRELNKHPPYIQDHPLHLWLDYGCEHRGRKLNKNGEIVSTLEFTESYASRQNEDEHIGTPLVRGGKFYFAHGSSAWRECPVCGRMTFLFGFTDKKWEWKSKELLSFFPFPIFEDEKDSGLTAKEKEWRKNLRYDSIQCMHCGAETKSADSPMIMQTMYKSTPTSFLEEIQRDVRIAVDKARHIVLLGYSFPKDDTIWQQTFSEAVRSKLGTEEATFCSVVVGFKGEQRWLYDEELLKYVESHKKDDEKNDYGTQTIENAIAIFGKGNVRAFTGGIPQVFGNCTESDVQDLFYPKNFVNWNGTRKEERR